MKVTIYNKVGMVILPREITVVDEIQGLTLNVPDEVIVAGVSYKYTVTPRPNIMGIVQYYEWDSNETMPHGLKITKDPHNSFKLPSGKHIITVTAKNCHSSAMSNPVSVQAVAKLVHLTISAKSNKLLGQAVEFQAMFWEGDYLNFTWQFGDGTDDVVIQDRVYINHTYHSVGEYTVKLTAINPISLMTASLKVFILNKICNPPDVSIVSQIHGQKQLSFLRSEVIHIEAKVKVNECQLTSVVFYSWMLIDTATNRQLYIRPHDDQSLKQLSLILPPRSIEYGHYTVKLKVKMNNTIVYSVSEADIIIKKSPLIVTIDGGNFRRLNHKDILHLDGSQSEDSDKLEQSELMFQWSCIILNSLNNSCFKDVKWPPSVPSNMSTVVIPTRLLLKEKTDFLFNLTVMTPSGRSGFTDQVIKILRVDKVLSIKIKCKQCIGQLANPNYRISFETSCPGCLPSQTMYKWEVKLVHGKQHAPSAVHDFGQCVQPDGSSYVSLSSQKLGTTPEPKREVVTQSTSRKISKTTSTTSLPMLGPFMMNEGSSGRGRQRFGRGGIPETRINKGLRTPPELPYRESDIDLKERLPFPGRPRLRNLPRQHDSSDILTMPVLGEGSPGESGSSQGRLMGTSINEPIEQPGNARQFPDESSHMASKEDEDEDTLVGRPRPRNETKHVISQDSSTVRLLPEQTRTGLVKQSLVINPGVLMQGRTYVVKVTAHTLDNSSGVAMAYFKVNESPQKGLCEVSKGRSGVEVETIFRVFCREWKDEHMPLEFEVSYNLYKGDRKKLLYRGLSHEINFQLPAGNSTDGDRVYLHIGVLDGIRARTSVCPISIVVRRKPVWYDNSSDDAFLQHNEELQKSVQQGDSRTACILIDYLAKQLNRFTLPHLQRLRQDTRWELLNLLSAFPKRDEVEILQVAESLVSTTAVPSELKNRSLTKALEVLQSIKVETEALYAIKNAGIPDLLTLAVQAVSNIMQAVLQFPPNRGLKWVTDEALSVVDSLIKMELQYHCIGEEPIQRMAEFVSVLASHFSTGQKQKIHINDASFIIPPNILIVAEQSANHQCYQAHMTTFKRNPYGYDARDSSKVQSRIVSLDIYNCDGKEHRIENLDEDNLVEIWIPRNNVNNKNSSQHVLKRNVMNIHQFNITNENMVLSLFITLDLNKIKNGRPFPISVLIGQHNPPTPEVFYYKEELDKHVHQIKLFLPSGSFNATGMYYLGVVDAGYNAGRRRPGELMDRSYSLLLWWGGCFYWDTHVEHWSADGCTITKQSTFEKSHCRCNHLTAFGGHFDLSANNLSFTDVDEFFGLNENPVVIILVVVILCIYSGLMVVCRKADLHDSRKCGLINLKDNRPTDKHKYEITVETGYRQGAGTTAKISFILHGEEGMSETRELFCDDDRVLFEQNSRDIFIMSLPDTLGRLFKVQLWHNNHGPSPSWYLSRVTIKDLSTGKMFYFLCEKWFAVEEDDGKVEREIMVLDAELGFSRVFWAKGTQYVADFHMWLSPYTCPPYSRFTRVERLTCCLTAIMSYMCLNAVWYQSKQEYRGEFGLLDLSLRNIIVGIICSCIILPLNLFIAFLFRRSKIRYPGPEPDKVYPSGKQNGEQISERDEESVQPVMTYSILDQSILNWQGIQDWAQKQWLKRQLSVRSNTDSAKSRPTTQNRQIGGESERDPNSPTTELTSTSIVSPSRENELRNVSTIETKKHDPIDIPAPTGRKSHSPPSPHHPPPHPYSWNLSQGPLYSPRYLPLCQANATTVTGRNLSMNHDLPVLHVPVLQNIRHGYDTDLASSGFVDATSQSQATAERTRIKLVSETSSSGRQSNTEYVDNGRGWRLFLVFWCRYVAWFLCISISVTCAVITVLYGFRFGYNKSIQWLQSLYFTFMVCVFITQPLLILLVVLYTALLYRNNPAILNHHNDGYYGVRYDPRKMLDEGKAECCGPGEELEQGVAARQRSRYLRFARPPHEKTLIEARKKTIKEKRAFALFRSSIVQILLVMCIGAIAYGKDGQTAFNLNTAISKIFLKSGNQYFHSIKSISEFYSWCHTSFLGNLYDIKTPTSRPEGRFGLHNTVLIGSANLRQLRVKEEACLSEFAFPINVFPGISNCRYSYTQQHKSTLSFGPNSTWTWLPSTGGITLWGKYGFYDNSGFVTELKDSRDLAGKQIDRLESSNWIDKQTRAVIIEFTIYYIPSNLFSCVSLLVETPESGGVFVKPFIASTYLFRYLSAYDNFILAFELLFFVISLHQLKCELVAMVKKRKEYFTSFWCIIEMLMCVFSLVYVGCYIYRYILISDTVEHLRNTYYQQFINISFICCWNELLQTLIGCVLFLLCVQLVRLLNRNAWCVKAANFYKKSQRELSLFMLLFGVLVMAFSSAGVALFGTACEGVQGVWSSMFTMVMTLTGVYPEPNINQSQWSHLFMFVYVVFTTGLLSAYILAVMNRRVKTEKSSDVLQMNGVDCVCFLWDKFLTKLGVRQIEKPEEPNNVLPAEFIMAEIEYQVDELLFRMNALSGSSALPDKPRAYFTDSDTTHVGDDGISTGGSEHDHEENGRLGQRVQRIENKLYANEPYLAQLLKLDSVGADILSQEKEKQLRSHLELEIFRQLQLQRQEVNDTDGPLLLTTTTTDNSGHNTEQSNTTSTPDSHNLLDKTWIPADLTGLENLLKLREALPKSSSSSPDSTHDTRDKNQQSYSEQIKNCIKAALEEAKKTKQSSSSDNVSPQSSESDKAHVRTDSSSGQSSNTGSLTKHSPQSSQNRKADKTKSSNLETPKAQLKPASSISTPKSVPKIKPAIAPKPSFIKKLSDSKHGKSSPKLRHLHLVPESASIKDGVVQMAESSSGSEQDAGHSLKRTSGKRALRKTRSQGRGKGHLLDLETDVFGEEEEAEIDDET